MKRKILTLLFASLLLSCSNDENSSDETINFSGARHRNCASHEILEKQMKANPDLVRKMAEIEEITNLAIAENRIVNGVLEIPVVFNVLYRTTSENISLAQLQSQIDVLNNDFRGTNSD